jgi:hypothetical protein
MTTCFIQPARQHVFDADLESRLLQFRREPWFYLTDVLLEGNINETVNVGRQFNIALMEDGDTFACTAKKLSRGQMED